MSVDIIGPLPKSRGYNAIMVVVDQGNTKQVIAIPTTIEQTAEGTARLYRDHVFKRVGLFKRIISDRGKEFVSSFMKELFTMLKVEMNPSTAYHPQTDGQTERVNAEIEVYLRQWVNEKQNDWAEWLAIAEFALNNRASSATGESPFFLNHGRHPRMNVEPRRDLKNESAMEFAARMKKSWEDAKSALDYASDLMKAQVDKHRADAREYNIGDKVWLEATNINTKRPSKKLDDRRYGPFEIIKKVGRSAYQLKLPKTWKAIHPVFNEALLTPYVPPEAKHQKKPPPPPPDVVDGHEEFEVEEILAARKIRGKLQYLVKWKGFAREDNTWEPAEHITHADEELENFYRAHPDAPGAPGPSATTRRLSIPRSLFPADFFKKHARPPITTGVDTALPTERFLARYTRRHDCALREAGLAP